MSEKKEIKTHLTSSVLPALRFGAISGVFSGVAVTVYKLFARGAVRASSSLFAFLKGHLWWIPAAILLIFGISWVLERIYQKEPDLQGGGIPASIGTLRGLFAFRPLKTVVGSFFLSLLSFLFGVPLGTEGPSVQLSTALGAGAVRWGSKRNRAWERYSMTGGACGGFAVATGAPISGIFFAVEEVHGRISPLIILTAMTAVLFAELCAWILSPILGVDVAMFELENFKALELGDVWMPLLAGVAMGVFSLLFLKVYRALDHLIRKKWRAPGSVKIFTVFCVTLGAGLISQDFVSTGHHLVMDFFVHYPSFLFLIAIIAVRSCLTLSANISGITGGSFLPMLAIGGAVGVLLGKTAGEEYIPLFVVFGISGCIAGMMKMPLTATIFGVETLGLSSNLFPLVLVCILAYAIPEALGEDSIGECVLERRKEKLREGKNTLREELEYTVEEHSFAVGKEIRDIFWPDGVRVLSVKKAVGGQLLAPGDLLQIGFTTCDREKTLAELDYILKRVCDPENSPKS